MFNTANQFIVPIQSGGRKQCKVRFPTDGEWCERARKFRSVRRFLGRGKSEAESPDSTEINRALFDRIRIDRDGPVFDGYDASVVLGKLERATVEEVEREGDNFRVTLSALGATTEHVVRMPTCREMDRHQSGSVKVANTRGAQEIREFLEPSGDLYDAIAKEGGSGYIGPIPIIHKVAVVAAVVMQMAADDEEPIPEESAPVDGQTIRGSDS